MARQVMADPANSVIRSGATIFPKPIALSPNLRMRRIMLILLNLRLIIINKARAKAPDFNYQKGGPSWRLRSTIRSSPF
jgi:hypothetical protein